MQSQNFSKLIEYPTILLKSFWNSTTTLFTWYFRVCCCIGCGHGYACHGWCCGFVSVYGGGGGLWGCGWRNNLHTHINSHSHMHTHIFWCNFEKVRNYIERTGEGLSTNRPPIGKVLRTSTIIYSLIDLDWAEHFLSQNLVSRTLPEKVLSAWICEVPTHASSILH